MRFTPRASHLICAIVCIGLLAAAGCVVNPATGKREISLVSESEEIRLGRGTDPAIVAQYGEYADPQLAAYVERLGDRLAAESERPELPWTFRVLDDPLVNAFALPGGYIYITRGILAHFDNEAELASVLGHEIGHVTGRHGANQLTKSRLAGGIFGAASILAPDQTQQFGGLAQTATGLLFLKFGRADETEADKLGFRYLVRTGYDPAPMADVFKTLGRVSQASGSGAPPVWASTHPDPQNREGMILSRIRKSKQDLTGRPSNRDAFLDKVDGIVFGQDPRHGFFDDSTFHHPEMRFRMEFPSGWQSQNSRSAVSAVNGDQDALLQLSLSQQSSPDAAMADFFGQNGITLAGTWSPSISGMPSAGNGFEATLQDTEISGRVAWIAYNGQVFQMLAFSTRAAWPSRRDTVTRAIESFARETDSAVLNVQPQRVSIVKVDRTMSVDQFAQRYNAAVSATELAIINGLDEGESLQAGRRYKLVQ